LSATAPHSLRPPAHGFVCLALQPASRRPPNPPRGRVSSTPPSSTTRLATPETTAFDLVRYPSGAGQLNNTATVLSELAESLDPKALLGIVPLVRLPDVQRLGYLLDAVGERRRTGPLAAWLEARGPRVVPLRRGAVRGVEVNARWKVVPNEALELDL
jgi:hypothetical protein